MQDLPAPTAQSLADVQARFAIWRKNKKHRRRIPEDLWTAAVLLHHEYSVKTISKFLSLSHTELKKRIQLHPQFQDNCPDLPKQFVPSDVAVEQSLSAVVVQSPSPESKHILYEFAAVSKTTAHSFDTFAAFPLAVCMLEYKFRAAALRLYFTRHPRIFGTIKAERMPIMAIAIITSIKVKPAVSDTFRFF